MSYCKDTKTTRIELKKDYIFVRNLIGKGVIDALITEKQSKKLCILMQDIRNENFSEIWSKLMTVKGVRFEYQSN